MKIPKALKPPVSGAEVSAKCTASALAAQLSAVISAEINGFLERGKNAMCGLKNTDLS